MYYTHSNVAPLRWVASSENKECNHKSDLLVLEQVIVPLMNKQIPSRTNTGVSHGIILKTYHDVQGYHSIFKFTLFLFLYLFLIINFKRLHMRGSCLSGHCSVEDHQWRMVCFCIDTWLYCFMIKSCDMIPKCFILFSNCQECKGIQ